jgi:uncharacterized linocin/CFP29 family protein
MQYLPREDAPLSQNLWEKIDRTVVGAATSQLAGRRLLDLAGPLGFGVRAVGKLEQPLGATAAFHDVTATATSAPILPIPLIRAEFSLPVRDIAAAEENGNLLSLSRVAIAAIAAARLEDQLVFSGSPEAGIDGLMSVAGSERVELGDWGQIGRPVEDLIAAIAALDAAGFPGPYAAALSPGRYSALLRIYEHSGVTQLEHARQALSGGIVKAPALAEGGVVLAVGGQFAEIVVAQDMTTAFVGPRGAELDFIVVESLAPRIHVPQSICALGATPTPRRRAGG